MSWNDLRYIGAVCRPISGIRPPLGDRYSQFSANLSTTLGQLARELRMLDAENVVVEIDVPDRMIRLDGFPRADARTSSPAVVLAFDSKWGPLRYATAEFTTWQDNLRAIALSMEALRSVDRYRVSKRGEQYRGFRELTTGTDPADAIATPEQARAYLDQWRDAGGDSGYEQAIRRAIRATHPDHGGNPDDFRKVMRAKELLP